MTIKRIRANYHNGTEYDTHHYETQANQVLIMSGSGVPISTIEEALLEGKLVKNGNLNTLINTGLYQISGGTNLPSGMDATKSYLMAVKTTGVITHQEFVDHIKNDVHSRTIDGSTVGAWSVTGKSTADSIKSILTSIGSLSGLKTVVKTSVVSSVNEVVENLAKTNTELDKVSDRVGVLESHNHDNVYAKLSGGKLTGDISMANGKRYLIEDSGGTALSLGRVDAKNKVNLGDEKTITVISAKDSNVEVWDGKNSYRVYHSGNAGANSGLDADKLDGKHASEFPTLAGHNRLKNSQSIGGGYNLWFESAEDSRATGNIYWKSGEDTLARLDVSESGDMFLYGGNMRSFGVKSSGETYTEFDHVLNAKNRQVALRFKLNDKDAGAGFYMNTVTNQVGFHDWQYGGNIFRTDRDDQTVKFTNEIFIQGHRLSIQGGAPSGAKAGDIWIDI